ncbi:MAG TPA: S41 family peptidase [Vicinamibacterales bacterium]|nr:S41 family peptidase [Vicinamibacterales bacterium]
MRLLTAVLIGFLLQPAPAAVPDIAPLLKTLTETLEERYINADVAQRMTEAIRQRESDGVFAAMASRAEIAHALTEILQGISRDKHLRVFDSPPPRPTAASRPPVGRHEVLGGNIGYLEVPSFVASPNEASPAFAAAMQTVAGTNALIVDVRGNGGGQPGTVALLAAYFLKPGPVLLATIENRSLGTRVESRTPATVAGPPYGEMRPIYVLIDRRTASAGESLAYFLQAAKRATVIGETSAGAANPGGIVRLPSDFAAFVPTGRVTNPVTGTNWEGRGVVPDLVSSSTAALDVALQAATAAVKK